MPTARLEQRTRSQEKPRVGYNAPSSYLADLNTKHFFEALDKNFKNGRSFHNWLTGLAYHFGIYSNHDIDEVVAQFYLDLSRKGLKNFDGLISGGFEFFGDTKEWTHVRNYLITCFHNLCFSYLREQKRNKEVCESNISIEDFDINMDQYSVPIRANEQTIESPLEKIAKKEEIEKLYTVFERLDPTSRDILVLREYMDLKYSEISEEAIIPIGTVKSRLNSANKKLCKLYLCEELWNSTKVQDYVSSRRLELFAEDAEKISMAMRQLEPKYRQVLLLHYISELSYRQIGEKLALPLGTSKYWVHMGRNHLFRLCDQQSLNYPELLHNLFYKNSNNRDVASKSEKIHPLSSVFNRLFNGIGQ